MLNFFIRHKLIGLLLLSIISIIGIVFYLRPQKQPEPPTTKTKIDTVVIGKSSKEDVIKILGNPISEETKGKFDVLTFGSASPTRPDQVYLVQNVALMTKEIISFQDQRKTEAIINNYGVAKTTLYGSDTTAGFYLFVYPDKGLAYLGNPKSGDLLEIWHFAPTNLQSFKSELAPNYSETLPPPVQ